VVPKSIREEIGLHSGDEVEVRLYGAVVQIERVAANDRLVERDGLLIVPAVGVEITSDDVRRIRLDLQR